MKNEEIIARIAVNYGIYTETEITDMIARGQDIPPHTFQGWCARGMSVRKGEQGIACRLWRKKQNNKNNDENENLDEGFYLTRSFLFREDQVEKGD